MPRKWYVGVENKARKVITPYIGVNGKARRVIKAYVGVNGVARYYYKRINVPTLNITYTGEWEDKLDVVMKGKTYRLLTLKTSGTLTIPETVACDLWMIGGGNGGERGGVGGAGGYSLFEKDITVKENSAVPVVVGSAGIGGYEYTDKYDNEIYVEPTIGGFSSFGQYKTKAGVKGYPQNGGSGGGAHGSRSNILGGTGDGLSKYPFEDNVYFEHPHGGAGGGGGNYYISRKGNNEIISGGDGGSNGSYGGKTVKSESALGGIGGDYGGGNGGRASISSSDGANGTYYGAGGGGGGWAEFPVGSAMSESIRNGGNGYQGVVYVRIPYKQ